MIITTGINARIGASRSILRLGGVAFTITLSGLTDGEARPGSHASISAPLPNGVTEWVSQSWGFGDNAEAAQFGTGSSPTDIAGAAGNDLRWQGIDQLGRVWTGRAPIRYARPVAINPTAEFTPDRGETTPLDLSALFNFPAGFPEFYLLGREANGEVLDRDTGALDVSAVNYDRSTDTITLYDASD